MIYFHIYSYSCVNLFVFPQKLISIDSLVVKGTPCGFSFEKQDKLKNTFYDFSSEKIAKIDYFKEHLFLVSTNIPWMAKPWKVSPFRPVCHLTTNAFVRSIHNQSLLLTRNCGFA